MDNFIETVRVVSEVSKGNPTGYVTINKCDLTSDHKLFEGEAVSATVVTTAADVLTVPEVALVDIVPVETPAAILADNDPDTTATAKKPWDTN